MGRAVVTNGERATEACGRSDGQTCIDLHVNDITYFHITHGTTQALLEEQHTTGGCFKRNL